QLLQSRQRCEHLVHLRAEVLERCEFGSVVGQPLLERDPNLVDTRVGEGGDSVVGDSRHATAPFSWSSDSSSCVNPQSASVATPADRCSSTEPGVRENRGAGAGWRTPSISTKASRARIWGCSAASSG